MGVCVHQRVDEETHCYQNERTGLCFYLSRQIYIYIIGTIVIVIFVSSRSSLLFLIMPLGCIAVETAFQTCKTHVPLKASGGVQINDNIRNTRGCIGVGVQLLATGYCQEHKVQSPFWRRSETWTPSDHCLKNQIRALCAYLNITRMKC